MLALLPMSAGWTQDTLQDPFREGYFKNNIPNTGENTYRVVARPQVGNQCGITTKEMYAGGNAPMKVYGVAACMMTDKDLFFIPPTADPEEWWASFWSDFRDTATDECYEYLGIYLSEADSLVVQQEVMVHRKYDTPVYYVETGHE